VIRAVVVDDERHAREELVHLVNEIGDVEVVDACANAVRALQAVRVQRPDALFLDIQMPQIDGFEFLGMIDPELMPQVVFVTACDEHALKAFEKNALDYLLKPVRRDRLAQAVAKLKRASGRHPAAVIPARALERIPCDGPRGIKLVDLAEVEFVRSSEAGVYVVTPAGEFFTELTLSVLERRAPCLKRCHKQYLINMALLDEIVRMDEGGASLRMRSGRSVPVSRRLLLRLKEELGIPHRQSKV
jgi:two-component system LytT family response regulator